MEKPREFVDQWVVRRVEVRQWVVQRRCSHRERRGRGVMTLGREDESNRIDNAIFADGSKVS